VTAVQFYASEWSEQRAPMIIGAVFIVTALFLRGGLAGAIRRRTRPTEVVVDGPVAR
jgi:branched-chain amino acid transport system permease protein